MKPNFGLHLVFTDTCKKLDKKNSIQPNTFPKAEKLKSRKAIDELFKNGKSFFIHPYKVFFQIADSKRPIADGETKENEAPQVPNTEVPVSVYKTIMTGSEISNANRKLPTANYQLPIIQVGFAVSTKNFKHAVDRNRIKRLGREAYRLNKHALISHLVNQNLHLQVFFVFTNKSLPTFALAQTAMQACLRKLIKTAKKDEGLLQG